MRIAMIGTGYVGLVSGACLSEFGHEVICVDKDPAKIATLRQGGIPIYEPGLDEIVAANVRSGRLSFTTDLKEAVSNAEVIFIGVGTPSRRGDGHADLTYVYAAAEEIAKALTGYTVIVSRQCQLAPAARLKKSSRRHGQAPSSTWPPIQSFCAKALRSKISVGRTE